MTAIILVNWNGADDTLACLDSLSVMSEPHFVIVADNVVFLWRCFIIHVTVQYNSYTDCCRAYAALCLYNGAWIYTVYFNSVCISY